MTRHEARSIGRVCGHPHPIPPQSMRRPVGLQEEGEEKGGTFDRGMMETSPHHLVIPAKAGIQGNPRGLRPWIPAFAGMTEEWEG
jgi:hypothetical protein